MKKKKPWQKQKAKTKQSNNEGKMAFVEYNIDIEEIKIPNKIACLIHDRTRIFHANFTPPCVELTAGQAKRELYHSIIYNVPYNVKLSEIVELWLATKIDPPCFWLQYNQLGPGKSIEGKLLTIDYIMEKLNLTRRGVSIAIQQYRLPAIYVTRDFYQNTIKKHGGNAYHVNSLDFEEFLRRRQADAEYRAERREIRRKTRGRVNRPYLKRGRPKKTPCLMPKNNL
jgi:hypothetical protein